MKKLNYFLLGAAGLVLASCANEDLTGPGNPDGTANVTINLSTPEINSRAYSNGMTATQLQYAVYMKNGDKLTLLPSYTHDSTKAEDIQLKKQVSFQLVKGNTYTFVFWAGNSEAPYTIDFADNGATMTVDYDEVLANTEELDAFYTHIEHTVNGDASVEAHLYRPFAQINVGTNDYAAANAAGYAPTVSQIKVNNLYTTLNLLTDEVTDETPVTFSYKEFNTTEVFPVKQLDEAGKNKLQYMAMTYGLVAADQANVEVYFDVMDANKVVRGEHTVGSVPVRRNYRTNIYGALLTSQLDVNVVIEPAFEIPDFDQEVVTVADGMVKMDGVTYDTLKEAIEKAQADNQSDPVIYLGKGDIDANDQIKLSEVNFNSLTLKGASSPEDVVISVNNAIYGDQKSRASAENSIALNFENITMKRATGKAYNESSRSAFVRVNQENYKNCIISNCIQLLVHDSAKFENCTFNNSIKSGFDGYAIYYYAYDGSKVVVENCKFNVQSKAIVIYNEGKNQYDLTVNNSQFNAAQTDDKAAIQMHTEAGAIYGIVRINNTTATGFDPDRNNGLWCEEKNVGDHARTNNFNIYVDGELVQRSSLILVDGKQVSSVSEALKEAPEGSTVTIPAGNYSFFTEKDFTAKNITLDCAEGTVFEGYTKLDYNKTHGVDGLIVKNAKFSNPNGIALGMYLNNNTFENCVFEGNYGVGSSYAVNDTKFIGCTFIGNSAHAFHLDSKVGSALDPEMYFEDCTFKGSLGSGAGPKMVFKDCKFEKNENCNRVAGNFYADTKFDNCDFDCDLENANSMFYTIDLVLNGGAKFEFINTRNQGENIKNFPFKHVGSGTIIVDGEEIVIQ